MPTLRSCRTVRTSWPGRQQSRAGPGRAIAEYFVHQKLLQFFGGRVAAVVAMCVVYNPIPYHETLNCALATLPPPPPLNPSLPNVTPLPQRLREHPRLVLPKGYNDGKRWQGGRGHGWLGQLSTFGRSGRGRRNHHLKITHNWHIGLAPTCCHRGASGNQNVLNLLFKQTVTDGNTVLVF